MSQVETLNCKWASSVPERNHLLITSLLSPGGRAQRSSAFKLHFKVFEQKNVFLLIRKFMPFTIMKANEHLHSLLQCKWVEMLFVWETAECFHKILFPDFESEWLAHCNFCLPLMFFYTF